MTDIIKEKENKERILKFSSNEVLCVLTSCKKKTEWNFIQNYDDD